MLNLTKEQHQVLCKSPKKCDSDLAMIKQALGEESMSHTWKVQTHRNQKRQDKVKSMVIIFHDIKGIVNKEFVLAGLTINNASLFKLALMA
jgi:hypothetical protein